jgi:uncharacterized protein (TIGR02271 family)
MSEQIVIPVIAEEAEAGARQVKTGAVRVRKTVVEQNRILHQALASEHVEVERIPKNEMVAGPLPVRDEGDTIVIPVVEEVVRIEKSWRLTEEIRLNKHRTEHVESIPVTVHRDQVTVERIPADQERMESASEKIGK